MYEIDNEINEIYFIYLLKRKNRNDGVVTYYTRYTTKPLSKYKEYKSGTNEDNKEYIILGMYIVVSGLPTERLAKENKKIIDNYNLCDKLDLIQRTKLKQ